MAAIKLYNLARMTTATTGTGTITLGSAVSGFLTFAQAGVQDGETVRYAIKDGSNSEIGYGVYTSSGTTLTRNVLKSTNSDAAINLSGSAEVIITPAAEDLLRLPGVGLHNGKITESHAANAATFHLKTIAGNDPSINDPVLAVFPDGSMLAISSALSVTVPSGATMGFLNATNHRIWAALVNDAGTPRIALRNCLSSFDVVGFPSIGLLSSTAMGTGSDNAQVTYTDSAVTDKPYVLAAYADYDANIATAGTWDASPSRIVQFGPGVHKPGDQVQSRAAVKTDTFTSTSTSYVDITGLSLSLTPRSKQNIVRLAASVYGMGTSGTNAAALRSMRDSTPIGIGDAAGSRTQASAFLSSGLSDNAPTLAAWTAFDWPQSTSALSYHIEGLCNAAGTFYINRSQADLDAAAYLRATSSILLQEIMT
jgi:hypothetical protein